jgi:hypothetical protein
MQSLNESDGVELKHVGRLQPSSTSNGDILSVSTGGVANIGFTSDTCDDEDTHAGVKPADADNQLVTVSNVHDSRIREVAIKTK